MSAVADRVRVQRSKAAAAIAERIRQSEVWRTVPFEARLSVASRLLDARLRLNRSGLLRWRREGRFDA